MAKKCDEACTCTCAPKGNKCVCTVKCCGKTCTCECDLPAKKGLFARLFNK